MDESDPTQNNKKKSKKKQHAFVYVHTSNTSVLSNIIFFCCIHLQEISYHYVVQDKIYLVYMCI